MIPYRVRRGRAEILLVTSRSGRRWVIPKGIVEPGLSPRRSAGKEALEEAGIEGKIPRKSVGSFTYTKWSGLCTVVVFEMRVDRQYKRWPEQIRKRRWFSPPVAAKKVDEQQLKTLILQVGKRIVKSRA